MSHNNVNSYASRYIRAAEAKNTEMNAPAGPSSPTRPPIQHIKQQMNDLMNCISTLQLKYRYTYDYVVHNSVVPVHMTEQQEDNMRALEHAMYITFAIVQALEKEMQDTRDVGALIRHVIDIANDDLKKHTIWSRTENQYTEETIKLTYDFNISGSHRPQ